MAAGSGATAALSSIEIAPANNRVGQEVRNHLIFLFGGGGGQPADPAYRLVLRTSAVNLTPTEINTPRVRLEPTAGAVSVRSSYELTEIATGRVVASGVRAVQSPFDVPGQEFAALRAMRDAENRAARELAELLRLVVAQGLQRSIPVSASSVTPGPEELERINGNVSAGGAVR
jgi:LPS-assembly lipoprotein